MMPAVEVVVPAEGATLFTTGTAAANTHPASEVRTKAGTTVRYSLGLVSQ